MELNDLLTRRQEELSCASEDALFGALCIEAWRKAMPANAISDHELIIEGHGCLFNIMVLRRYGMPYGPIGRAVFEWMIANAHLGSSQTPIDLGHDPRALMDEMGIMRSSSNEESAILDFIDQFKRLSAIRLDFTGTARGFARLMNMSFVTAADFNWRPFESRWAGRPNSKILLNGTFIAGALLLRNTHDTSSGE